MTISDLEPHEATTNLSGHFYGNSRIFIIFEKSSLRGKDKWFWMEQNPSRQSLPCGSVTEAIAAITGLGAIMGLSELRFNSAWNSGLTGIIE